MLNPLHGCIWRWGTSGSSEVMRAGPRSCRMKVLVGRDTRELVRVRRALSPEMRVLLSSGPTEGASHVRVFHPTGQEEVREPSGACQFSDPVSLKRPRHRVLGWRALIPIRPKLRNRRTQSLGVIK